MNFVIKKNYDDVFMRSIIVALSKFLYDVIKIRETRDGEEKWKKVKIFFGASDQQYLSDLFLDPHQQEWFQEGMTEEKYRSVIEGSYREVPYGVFTIEPGGVQPGSLSGGYSRATFVWDVENDFGVSAETFSARTNFIPETFNVNLEIKASSEIERMKIYDVIMEKLWKVNTFYFRHNGFQKLPCSVLFPENTQMDKNLNFRSNASDKLPMLKLSLKLETVRPVIDESTIMMTKNKAKVLIVNARVVLTENGYKKYPLEIVPDKVSVRVSEAVPDNFYGEEKI